MRGFFPCQCSLCESQALGFIKAQRQSSWFTLFYTANAYFWSPQNFYTVSLTVIQCMHVCWGNGRIKIPCMSWWHGSFADRSVFTGWNQTHRHQDTPEAQTESSSAAVCHGTARLSPLPPRHSNLPGSTPVWACAARHLSTCVTRGRNKTTARTKWDLAISANTSQPEPTNRLAGGGADGAVRASWII